MNRSPSLMSPSGWSSPEVPFPSVSNAGSMKLTLGKFPAATVSINDGVVTGIPSTSVSPGANGCQNGKYLRPHSARNGRALKKSPPGGLRGGVGMVESWSQIDGSDEITVLL